MAEALHALQRDDIVAAVRSVQEGSGDADAAEVAHSYLELLARAFSGSDTPARGKRDVALQVALALKTEGHHAVGLALLREVRRDAPFDETVANTVKEIAADYLEILMGKIGNPGFFPRIIRDIPAANAARWADVIALVDGKTTTGEILAQCVLGRLATCQRMVELLETGVIAASKPGAAMMPRRKRRGTLEIVLSPGNATIDDSHSSLPPQSVSPESGARASGPNDPADEFDELFKSATSAYLRRDYDAAMKLFSTCAELRPQDVRVTHNIERLRQRKDKER